MTDYQIIIKLQHERILQVFKPQYFNLSLQ